MILILDCVTRMCVYVCWVNPVMCLKKTCMFYIFCLTSSSSTVITLFYYSTQLYRLPKRTKEYIRRGYRKSEINDIISCHRLFSLSLSLSPPSHKNNNSKKIKIKIKTENLFWSQSKKKRGKAKSCISTYVSFFSLLFIKINIEFSLLLNPHPSTNQF